jgi:hypothetical protein
MSLSMIRMRVGEIPTGDFDGDCTKDLTGDLNGDFLGEFLL